MGTDNLFKRRKPSNTEKLKRKAGQKDPSPPFLIVCEGSKTEPQYFTELRNHERISGITVKVCGDCGSAPISVVEYAVKSYKQYKKEGIQIQKVYCVYDKDNHASYYQACSAIATHAKNGIPIEAITSIPCFEYWLLLHFRYQRSSFQSTLTGTSANEACKALDKALNGYKKGKTGLYTQIKNKQADAIGNAEMAFADSVATGQDDPSTKIHQLVKALLEYSTI